MNGSSTEYAKAIKCKHVKYTKASRIRLSPLDNDNDNDNNACLHHQSLIMGSEAKL